MIGMNILDNRIKTFLDEYWQRPKAEKFAMHGWYYEKENNSVQCWKCKAVHRGAPNEDLPRHKPDSPCDRTDRRSRSGSEVSKQDSEESGYQSEATPTTPKVRGSLPPGWTPANHRDRVLPSLVETPSSSAQAGSNLPGEGGFRLPSETPTTQPPAETSTTTENPAVKPPAEGRTGPGESSSKARGRSPSSPAERGFKDGGEAATGDGKVAEVRVSKASPQTPGTPAGGGSQSQGWSGSEPGRPPDHPPSNTTGHGRPCRPRSWLDSGGPSDPALHTGSGEPRSQAPAAPSDSGWAGLSQAPSGSGSDAALVSPLRTGRRPPLQRQVSIDGTRGRAVRIVSGSFSEFPHDPEQDLGQDPDQDPDPDQDQDPVQDPEHDLDQDSEDDLYQYSEGEDDVFLDNQVERHVVGEQRHPEDTYGGLEEGVEEAVGGVDPTQSPPPQTPREGQPLYWEGLPSDRMESVDGMAPLGEPLPSVAEGGSVLFPTDERDGRTDKGSQVRQPEERQCYVCKCDIIPGQQVERCTTQQCRNAWHPPCANETLTPTITTPQLAPAGAAAGPAAAGAAGRAPRRCHDCKIRTRRCRPCAREEVATPGRLTEWVECEGCRAAYHDTCLEKEFQSRGKIFKVYDNGCEDIVAKIVATCHNCRDFDERVDSE